MSKPPPGKWAVVLLRTSSTLSSAAAHSKTRRRPYKWVLTERLSNAFCKIKRKKKDVLIGIQTRIKTTLNQDSRSRILEVLNRTFPILLDRTTERTLASCFVIYSTKANPRWLPLPTLFLGILTDFSSPKGLKNNPNVLCSLNMIRRW